MPLTKDEEERFKAIVTNNNTNKLRKTQAAPQKPQVLLGMLIIMAGFIFIISSVTASFIFGGVAGFAISLYGVLKALGDKASLFDFEEEQASEPDFGSYQGKTSEDPPW